ncbi:MAG: hypothetical protein RBU27_02870 [Bacteroidota bacterium]|jgi:hypothetical protein|nr:hypothetical protein [Bacteroidota bacterium]
MICTQRLSILAALCFALVTLLTTGLHAQRSAGDRANIDPKFLVDMPVAGIIPTTAGAVETYLYPNGGLLAAFTYGLLPNLNIGLSFGGTNLIGSGGITWNNLPGISARYRVMEESNVNPAVVAGFDSQGRDGWIPSMRQYVMKSPGFFVAVSKNYQFHGTISFHGGANYTLERNDEDYDPNLYIGMEKSIGPIVSWLAEYNFAFDNDRNSKGFWNGSLGTGFRISTNIGFNADILFKNLLTSEFPNDKVIRAIRIQYVRYL